MRPRHTPETLPTHTQRGGGGACARPSTPTPHAPRPSPSRTFSERSRRPLRRAPRPTWRRKRTTRSDKWLPQSGPWALRNAVRALVGACPCPHSLPHSSARGEGAASSRSYRRAGNATPLQSPKDLHTGPLSRLAGGRFARAKTMKRTQGSTSKRGVPQQRSPWVPARSEHPVPLALPSTRPCDAIYVSSLTSIGP